MITAPTSNVIVSDHCAFASDIWLVRATVGTNGAPRLPITATTRPMKISTGSQGSRGRGDTFSTVETLDDLGRLSR